MEMIQAQERHLQDVYGIVRQSIEGTYPDYYPQAVCSYFLELHSRERILGDIRAGRTYLLRDENQYVATGTVLRRHLTRIFVLPGSQKKGYGTAVMDFLEQKAGELVKDAIVESSLPGCIFYEKRGYRTVKHCSVRTESGAVLVYELMQKKLREGC